MAATTFIAVDMGDYQLAEEVGEVAVALPDSELEPACQEQ